MAINYAEFGQKDKIKEIHESDEHWIIHLKGSCFGLDKKYGVEPKVGDTIELAGALGSQIAGVRINGKVVFHKSEDDLKEDHRLWVENYHIQQMKDFEKNRRQMDLDFDELNDVFKKRIVIFRLRDPDFRWKEEAYEMAAVREANHMVKFFKTGEEVKAFRKLSWEEQAKVYPPKVEGHSGNTWGHAIQFAYAYFENPNNLIPIEEK